MPALVLGIALAYRDTDPEELEGRIWDWVAYGTRYGKGATIQDLLHLPSEGLSRYLDALGRLVDRENESMKK